MNQPDFDAVTRDFSLLLEVTDFDVYTSYVEKSFFALSTNEDFREFLASEQFGKDLQRRISAASDLGNTMSCLSYVRAMNKHAVDMILGHRGFAQSTLPAKINNEYDVNTIGLCIEVTGYHVKMFTEIAVYDSDSDIDFDLLVEKFNFEEDLYNIGHALERINRVDCKLTKKILEHGSYNHDRIKELISQEQNEDKKGEYLYAVKIAAPELSRTTYNQPG